MPKKKSDDYYRHRETYKDIKIDIRCKNRDELAERVRQRKDEIDKSVSTVDKHITVQEWGEKWVETYKKGRVKDSHYTAIKYVLKNHIYPIYGSKEVSDVLPIDLQNLLDKYGGKSKSTISHIKSVLHEMFSAAALNRIIEVSPATELISPKGTVGTRRALTDEERDALLSVCETSRYGLWILMLYYCGLRPQESVVLRWSDIDFDNGTVSISKALESYVNKEGTPKTKSSMRVLSIPINYFNRLKRERGADDELIFKTSAVAKKSGEICKQGGKMATGKTIQRWWQSFKREMDIAMGAKTERNKIIQHAISPDITLYCLRHNYATDLMRAGVPLNVAMHLMGHTDTRMLERVYAHRDKTLMDDAVKKLDIFYAKVGSSAGSKGDGEAI